MWASTPPSPHSRTQPKPSSPPLVSHRCRANTSKAGRIGDTLRSKLSGKASAALVSVFPTRVKNSTKSAPSRTGITTTTSPLVATVAADTLTFTRTVDGGLNIHTFVGHADAFYATTGEDTLDSAIAAVAAAIDALAIPGVVVTTSGATLTVTGAPLRACNVGPSTGSSFATEIGRTQADMQLSVWSNDPLLRLALRDAIVGAVGSALAHAIVLSDGSFMECLYENDVLAENAQETYNLYESHIMFGCDFANRITSPATLVEAARLHALSSQGAAHACARA